MNFQHRQNCWLLYVHIFSCIFCELRSFSFLLLASRTSSPNTPKPKSTLPPLTIMAAFRRHHNANDETTSQPTPFTAPYLQPTPKQFRQPSPTETTWAILSPPSTPPLPTIYYPSTDADNAHYTGKPPPPWHYVRPTFTLEKTTADLDALPKHLQPIGWGNSTTPSTPHAHTTSLSPQQAFLIHSKPMAIVDRYHYIDPALYSDIILEQTLLHEVFHPQDSPQPLQSQSYAATTTPHGTPRTTPYTSSRGSSSSTRKLTTFKPKTA